MMKKGQSEDEAHLACLTSLICIGSVAWQLIMVHQHKHKLSGDLARKPPPVKATPASDSFPDAGAYVACT